MPYIDGILIPYVPPSRKACAAIIAGLERRDAPAPAVVATGLAEAPLGLVDCPYCGRKGVAKTHPAQVTCGKWGCDNKRRQENSARYYRKGRGRA